MHLLRKFLKIIFSFLKLCPKRPQLLYHTENFIALYKPHDMKINSDDKSQYTLQSFLKENFSHLANQHLRHEYYFPHRLDYSTSGIVCIPLNKNTCRAASKAFQNRKTKKYYVALVRGIVSERKLDINISIGEDVRFQVIQKMCTNDNVYCKYPRNARTLFLVLETGIYKDYPATKILMRPITGRRHQLRVHCSYLGHTIVGDYTYSNRKDKTPPRMYLHSIKLILPTDVENLNVKTVDPITNELVPQWKTVNSIFNKQCDMFEEIDKLA